MSGIRHERRMNFCCHRRFRRASTFESNDAMDELLTKVLETHAAALGRIKTLVDRHPLSAVKQAYEDFREGHLVGRAVLIPEASAARAA
jgi:hypothetical protein